jgi:hypothetical protein
LYPSPKRLSVIRRNAVSMKNILEIAILAFLVLSASSSFAFADEDEGDDNEGEEQTDGNEQENRMPGFEVALAFACSLGAARLLRKSV